VGGSNEGGKVVLVRRSEARHTKVRQLFFFQFNNF
jgi:hypothetical protein